MYSVGNVKTKLKQIIYQNNDKFILIYCSKVDLYIALVEKSKNKEKNIYEIKCLHHEFKRFEENFFYQESMYCFQRECKIDKIPVYIFLDDSLIWEKEYEFPKMADKDIEKALLWEIDELQEKYIFGYDVGDLDDNNINVKVIFYEKEYFNEWKTITEEYKMLLAGIVINSEAKDKSNLSTEKNIKGTLDIVIDEEYLDENIELNLLRKSIISLQNKTYINLLKKESAILNWYNIKTIIIAITIFFSSIFGMYAVLDYYNVKEQHNIITEDFNLLQDDIKSMNELKDYEKEIKSKQELLKILYEKSSTFYSLLLNLSTNTLDGIKLNAVINNDDKKMIIKGKAVNYQIMAQYKQNLTDISWIESVEIESSVFNETDNLIEFTFLLKAK